MFKYILPVFTAFIFMMPTMAIADHHMESETKPMAKVGELAPDFTGETAKGEEFKLSDHKGQLVVLEWTNHECPFVKKHYSSGNMQETQKTAHSRYDVTWVSVVSSAQDHQGHTTPEEALEIIKEQGAHINAKILDESGEIGHLYGAKTTPHMFIINKDGILVYAGAIDSNSSPDPKTIEGAENYVLSALEDLKEGRAIKTPKTKPYGCGVKYAY